MKKLLLTISLIILTFCLFALFVVKVLPRFLPKPVRVPVVETKTIVENGLITGCDANGVCLGKD